MKFSLKFPDDQNLKNPIVKGKLPISMFNHPFTSSFTSSINSSSDLSLSLSSNFQSGPCFKLNYSPSPTPSSSSSSSSSSPPFSFSLKSGLGLFGSPQNSPLVFSAHFPLSLSKPIVPTFSLIFKPQFGHFCLKKSTFSNPNSDRDHDRFSGIRVDDDLKSDSESFSNGFVVDGSMGWQELRLEPSSANGIGNGSGEKHGVNSNGGLGFGSQRHLVETKSFKDGVFSGVAVMARTVIPVTKRVAVNFRWGMNYPANLVTKMPFLTVNKISVERVEEGKDEKKRIDGDVGEMELLKGVLFWMKKDMENLEKENKEMKQFLEEIRLRNAANRVSIPSSGLSNSELEPWRNNKSGGEGSKSKNNRNGGQENEWRKKRSTEEENEAGKNNRRGVEKNGLKGHNSTNRVNEVESELERAIKAASQAKP